MYIYSLQFNLWSSPTRKLKEIINMSLCLTSNLGTSWFQRPLWKHQCFCDMHFPESSKYKVVNDIDKGLGMIYV